MKIVLSVLAAFCLAMPAAAQSARFDVVLAGRTLGDIAVTQTGADAELRSVMDNTPLGVGDGRFDATLTGGQSYRSVGASADETRRIDFDYAGDRVAEVRIAPEDEATDASDPGRVPAGVLDPARGFARIAFARDCVAPFRIYDGRRVVEVALADRTLGAEMLECDYAYRVVDGPGHLSPFRFREIAMTARYELADGAVSRAREIALGAGPFTVRLVNR